VGSEISVEVEINRVVHTIQWILQITVCTTTDNKITSSGVWATLIDIDTWRLTFVHQIVMWKTLVEHQAAGSISTCVVHDIGTIGVLIHINTWSKLVREVWDMITQWVTNDIVGHNSIIITCTESIDSTTIIEGHHRISDDVWIDSWSHMRMHTCITTASDHIASNSAAWNSDTIPSTILVWWSGSR